MRFEKQDVLLKYFVSICKMRGLDVHVMLLAEPRRRNRRVHGIAKHKNRSNMRWKRFRGEIMCFVDMRFLEIKRP